VSNNIVVCPSCGNDVEISEAFRHQIEESLLTSEREKHQKELAEAKNKANQELLSELKILKEEASERNKKLEDAMNAELELRKEKNKLEDEKKEFELTKQRQLDEEREKIRLKTADEIAEQQRLKDKEKDKKIDDLMKALEDAQRKASQGSQQLQGEIQELDLEELLRSSFPGDAIEAIGKGVLGADIRQVVRSPRGILCGTILWESKRTKTWSSGWIEKLKEDGRKDKANITAIVSEAPPEEIKNGIGVVDGVWVCLPKFILPLSMLLRKSLLDVAREKLVAENRQEKADQLYTYVTGHEFVQQVESMIEIYREMQAQIIKERTAYERMWKLREAQVTRLMSGVGGIYGSMQGIAGSALSPIRSLELDDNQEQLKLD